MVPPVYGGDGDHGRGHRPHRVDGPGPGDALIAPSVTRRLIKEFAARPTATPPRRARLDGITDREREVLTLVGSGLSNAEIADRLYISVATAKTYLTRLLAKLDARDRVQLVILAYEAGLVAPSGS